MYSFMLGTVVAGFAWVASVAVQDAKGPDAKSLDGAWTVVCFEKDGQPQADARGMTVKGEGGTLTCSGRDGKAVTLKIAFGPNGTAQVTEGTGDTTAATAARAGVYVLTKEYVAISLNGEAAPAAGESKPAADGPTCPSRCSLILRREGARPGGVN